MDPTLVGMTNKGLLANELFEVGLTCMTSTAADIKELVPT